MKISLNLSFNMDVEISPEEMMEMKKSGLMEDIKSDLNVVSNRLANLERAANQINRNNYSKNNGYKKNYYKNK